MRVLFLDIDGVLNNWDSATHPESLRIIDPINVKVLNGLFEKLPDVQVVLSSTWREYFTIPQVNAWLRDAGYTGPDLLDVTPFNLLQRGRFCDRGEEIAEWLARHPECKQYAIIDDITDLIAAHHPARYVTTHDATGMTSEHLTKLLEIFADQPA